MCTLQRKRCPPKYNEAALRVHDNRINWRMKFTETVPQECYPTPSAFLLSALTKTFHCERPMVGLINFKLFSHLK